MSRLILTTAFGPFPGVGRNPSREIAAALERDPAPGVRVVFAELPVTFRGVPSAIDAFLERHAHERPAALLGLGVQKEPRFLLERRARGRITGDRLDNDGSSATESAGAIGPDLDCGLDLEPLAGALREVSTLDVGVSEAAGGYVCERTFHHLLLRGNELGIPTVFLHVPPATALPFEEQARVVRALLPLLG